MKRKGEVNKVKVEKVVPLRAYCSRLRRFLTTEGTEDTEENLFLRVPSRAFAAKPPKALGLLL